MEPHDHAGIIPNQKKGLAIKAESAVELDSIPSAKDFYKITRARLLDVNHWHEVSGAGSASFQLTDEHGRNVQRNMQEGDHLRIDIPGPGGDNGNGYDWVRIEEVKDYTADNAESAGFRVRPAENPMNRTEGVAHFYSKESTSNFIVTRENKKVTAGVYDRNTQVNTRSRSLLDKLRNAIVGSGGKMGFSKIQWKKLTDGLVHQR